MDGHLIFKSTVYLMWTAAAAGIAWYCATVASQMTYVTLADGRKQERRLPILFRLFLPLVPNVKHLFDKPIFESSKAKIDKQIITAGFHGMLTAGEFLSLRLLLPVIAGSFWLLIAGALVGGVTIKFIKDSAWLIYLIGPLWLFIFPVSWLRQAQAARHRSIRKSLPFVLDLLTLSVEAGMDFMTALQRNVERSKIDPLGEELVTVIREIQLGKTRREALRDMSNRVNLSDLRSVVSALIQADELGVSIGSILRIQSDQIRQRRFERAEKLANEAPVKMLGPLLFFIFPSVFLVLLGPIITRLLHQGF